jgi:hypothetical protein
VRGECCPIYTSSVHTFLLRGILFPPPEKMVCVFTDPHGSTLLIFLCVSFVYTHCEFISSRIKKTRDEDIKCHVKTRMSRNRVLKETPNMCSLD